MVYIYIVYKYIGCIYIHIRLYIIGCICTIIGEKKV